MFSAVFVEPEGITGAIGVAFATIHAPAVTIITGSGDDSSSLAANQASFASRDRSTQRIAPSASPVGAEAPFSLGSGAVPAHLRDGARPARRQWPPLEHHRPLDHRLPGLTDRTSASSGIGLSPFALAVRPRDGDLFFLAGHRIFRVRESDGLASTSAEDLFVGPATSARVNITTGLPRVTVGPDGLIDFANSNLVRVINPTDTEVTTFGLTLPPGHIHHLPTTLGANVSRVAFDRKGNLWVAPDSQNRLLFLRASSRTSPERVSGPDAESYGRMATGRLGDLRANGIIDMHFLPSCDVALMPQSGHLLYLVKADADGHLDADSPFVIVLGTGPGGGGLLGASRPVSGQSLTPGSLERDDMGLLMTIGGTAAVRLHVDP